MSSFFTLPASQKKRKRPDASRSASGRTSKPRAITGSRTSTAEDAPKRRKQRDESISGSESEGDNVNVAGSAEGSSTGSDDEDATAAERRLKLAERYLENVREDVREEHEVGFDAAEVDRELIAARLKEDVSEDKGRLYRHIARGLDFAKASQTNFGANQLATSGVAICLPYAYTVSKDLALVKWELALPPHAVGAKTMKSGDSRPTRRRKPKQLKYSRGNASKSKDLSFRHHTAPILCVAASADGRFVATGGADRRLIIWDAHNLEPLKVFTQHRDAVTALAFQGKTNQLFSASKDRTIKIWSLNELAYIETLFGHQDEVLDVAAVGGSQERCVSVGARDRTARLWKVVEESQLVFRGGGGMKANPKAREDKDVRINGVSSDADHEEEAPIPRNMDGSIDRVIQIDTQLFVTGSDTGAIALFALHKKKPLHIIPHAHGHDPALSVDQSYAELDPSRKKTQGQPTPRWITALACIPFSDVFVSGSWDGSIKVWKISDDQRNIESAGILGQTSDRPNLGSNEPSGSTSDAPQRLIKGIVNDLAIIDRGDRGKDGVCIVAGVGTQSRLGRWLKVKGINGAFCFEIPRLSSSAVTATE
ncbi:MAG: pre-rRNA processing protein [Chrysothrix sp. TS-e1954]|nr:MAG: pre-rRNA processing protein [Chrysothrix sp. TS-e1954]